MGITVCGCTSKDGSSRTANTVYTQHMKTLGTENADVKRYLAISAIRVQKLCRQGHSIADARKLLAEQAAVRSTPKAHLAEWKELQARVKAEMGIGRKYVDMPAPRGEQ
jgi:hypothetical protein